MDLQASGGIICPAHPATSCSFLPDDGAFGMCTERRLDRQPTGAPRFLARNPLPSKNRLLDGGAVLAYDSAQLNSQAMISSGLKRTPGSIRAPPG